MEEKTVNLETAATPDKKLLLRAAAWGFAAAIVRWAILAVGLFRHSTAMTNLCRILGGVSGVGFGVAFVVFIVRRGRNVSAWMLALLDVSLCCRRACGKAAVSAAAAHSARCAV